MDKIQFYDLNNKRVDFIRDDEGLSVGIDHASADVRVSLGVDLNPEGVVKLMKFLAEGLTLREKTELRDLLGAGD